MADQDTSSLVGRNVIVINSSYIRVPFAQYLVFGDSRWWLEHRRQLEKWKGRIVTAAPVDHPNVLKLKKLKPPMLATDPEYLTMARTTLTAAINLALHLGCARAILLGVDMQRGPSKTITHKGKERKVDGACHHHAPHPWRVRAGCWDEQMLELRQAAYQLASRDIEIINASPRSRIDWWPKKSFEECLVCT